MGEFLIARNPQATSALPFLLRLPLPQGDLWFKAQQTWPRTARVYCHPLGYAPVIEDLEILERVGVTVCQKGGPAIDLVLARRANKRSQFVFVNSHGRCVILWQTARSAKAARPGVRIPHTRGNRNDILYIDTRERYGYTFKTHQAGTVRRALPAGDYAAIRGDTIIASVERKRLEDFSTSLVDGSLNFVLAELAALPIAAVVVEGTYSALLRHKYTRPGFLPTLLARLQLRYPRIAIRSWSRGKSLRNGRTASCAQSMRVRRPCRFEARRLPIV